MDVNEIEGETEIILQIEDTEKCKCIVIEGHFTPDTWMLWPRDYKQSPGYLAIGDFTQNPFIWLHYVESNDGSLVDDDVLINTDTKYWSIHDVQRYFLGNFHCEQNLFTYQYPNLKLPTRHGRHLWKANAASKLPSSLYQKYFNISLENTLKKIESNSYQMDRLIISDQLIKLRQMHYFRRKKFMEHLLSILSSQNRLQLVSLENLSCSRLEGVRLIKQLASFNSESLKYLFLWRFVHPQENPIMINYSYITDEEKARLSKLINDLEVPDVKLSERCHSMVKEFRKKFGKEVEKEEAHMHKDAVFENPYKVDPGLLEENERKLKLLLAESKRAKIENTERVTLPNNDPKRPWRTNSCKEKLLRIDNELQKHREKASLVINPLCDDDMRQLVQECAKETNESSSVPAMSVKAVVDAATKELPNFQYRLIENSTATVIMAEAHVMPVDVASDPKVETIEGEDVVV